MSPVDCMIIKAYWKSQINDQICAPELFNPIRISWTNNLEIYCFQKKYATFQRNALWYFFNKMYFVFVTKNLTSEQLKSILIQMIRFHPICFNTNKLWEVFFISAWLYLWASSQDRNVSPFVFWKWHLCRLTFVWQCCLSDV